MSSTIHHCRRQIIFVRSFRRYCIHSPIFPTTSSIETSNVIYM